MTDDDPLAPALREIAWSGDLPADHLTTVVAGARRRRRQRRAAVAVAGATAAVLLGVSVATAVAPGPDRGPDATDATDATGPADRSEQPAPPYPDPPEGEKWVGMGALVIAVPASWPVISSPCGDGSPAVVLDGTASAVTDCRFYEDTRVSFVPLHGSSPRPSEGVRCLDNLPSSCFDQRAFPDQDVLVRVESEAPDAADLIDRLLDSAIVLPDGWVAVPFGDYLHDGRVRDLAEAGFAVEDRTEDRTAGGDDLAVRTEPPAGSPVREGSTITVLPLVDELTTAVRRLDPPGPASGPDDAVPPVGSARWDPVERTVTYRDARGACLPLATASLTGSVVDLELSEQNVDFICVDVGQTTLVTVGGLSEAPTELVVTTRGRSVRVPVS